MGRTMQHTNVVELSIGGMTCATCATRVEKKLNRMSGVTASVNFATETAHVEYEPTLTVNDLIATVEATGYTAAPPVRDEPSAPAKERDPLKERLIGSAILTVPVVALSMV